MDSGSYDHGLNAEPDKNVYKKINLRLTFAIAQMKN